MKSMTYKVILGITLLVTGSSIAQTTDLLISEYVEGSSSNKYIEVFNGTGAPIDLSNYEIRLYSNGNSSPNVTNALAGTLANGSTVVYSNSSATVYGGTTINLGAIGFNGDDAIELYNTSTSLTVDIFGVIGCDPGTQWISTSNRTQNRTLRRNMNVLAGVTSNPSCTPSSADFATLEGEWTEFPVDNVADLGSHSILGSTPIVDLGPDQSICSGSSTTLDSGGDGDTFLWSTGDTTSSITVSAAGNYSVTVTNANGSTTDDINVSFYPPTALAITDSATVCPGGDVEICASVLTADLIISEYIEGSGLIKCIEVYNGTGSSVDLGALNYSIDITYNGGSSSTSIALSGVVANGATHVLCDDGAGQTFLNAANQITNSNLWNGDDAIVLSKNGVAVDIFGVINSDPGAQWSGGGNSTQNSTLRRNSSVTEGITTNPTGTGTGAFTTLATEWTQGALNDPSNLGSHTVTGDGTFAWATGETTLCITVAPTAATNYTFSYTSAEGCVTDISTTVSLTTLSASVTATPILCNGGTSDVTVTATGGQAPYVGTGTFSETQGMYTYTVTDANGCTATASITITEPTPLTAYTSCPAILCNGGTQDMAVFAFGGTAPYTNTGLFQVGAGTYNYTIIDANGCTSSVTHVVTEPAPTVIASVSAATTMIDCNGGTVPVVVSATGGFTPYIGTGTFNATAGMQSFTVTDADGCTSTATITLTEPSPLVASASAGTILCNGGTTDITVTATGGTAPYTGTGTSNEGEGTYSFTITDANGCTTTTSVTLTEPAALVASASAGTILCNGGTADVTISGTGGTAPYTATGTFSQVAGTTTYTITDANGCTATTTVTLTEPAALVASASAGTILCNGGTADVTISGTGGTAPYTATGTFSQAAGTTTYTITDANGCTATISVTLSEPAALVASASAGTILCNGGTADVTISGTGGTAPYTATGTFSQAAGTTTYTITDANGCTATISVTLSEPAALVASASAGTILCNGGTADVTISGTGGTAPYTATGTFSQAAGTTTYTITDANGCTATTSVTLTEPAALTASITAGTILCNGGATNATATPSGGSAPYTYVWSSGFPLGTGSTVSGLFAGTVTVTIIDANGCSTSASVTITEPAALVASASAGTILCNGGTADVTVTATGGTAPYTATGIFSQAAGTVTYTVTDANGCTSTATVTLTEPTAIVASATAGTILCFGGTADVTVTATGGTAPYTATGTFSQAAGTTTYTVTDANGCTGTTTVTLTEPAPLVTSIAAGTILCNGGTADVTISTFGGTPSYSGTGTFSQSAGTVDYTITDANGCISSVSVNLTEPAPLVATASAGTILCNGGTADVTISAAGGTPSYSGTGTFSQSAGTVTYPITDANGCASSVSVTLTEPTPLVASATVGPVDPFAGTADVTVTATGGTPAYTGTGTVNLSGGNYNLTVTDANGCTSSVNVTISGGLDGFIIYPNPAVSTGDQVWVKVDAEIETDMSIRVLNLSGQAIYTESSHIDEGVNLKSIDVTGYTRGSYLIEVVTNKINQRKPLVVQ